MGRCCDVRCDGACPMMVEGSIVEARGATALGLQAVSSTGYSTIVYSPSSCISSRFSAGSPGMWCIMLSARTTSKCSICDRSNIACCDRWCLRSMMLSFAFSSVMFCSQGP